MHDAWTDTTINTKINTTIRTTMSLGDWLMLIGLSLLWGGSFFFIGVAVKELPPLSIVLFRVIVAALVLWIVVLVLDIPRPTSVTDWLALLVMGLINNVLPFSLIVWGQTYIEAGLASILNATTPLFGVIIAGMFLSDERLTRNKLAGVVIGFVGAVIMIGPAALKDLGISGTGGAVSGSAVSGGAVSGGAVLGRDVLAQLAIVGAAVSYGFAGAFGRRFKRMGMAPVTAAAGQVTMSALVLLPITFLVDQPLSLPMPSADVWLAIIALAVFSTGLAYILYFRILASAGASNLLLVTFLVPVSAILLGYFLLHERLEIQHFAGMFLIGIGLSAIDGRLWKSGSWRKSLWQ